MIMVTKQANLDSIQCFEHATGWQFMWQHGTGYIGYISTNNNDKSVSFSVKK